jgi:hypothetical protein
MLLKIGMLSKTMKMMNLKVILEGAKNKKILIAQIRKKRE